jgi:hypothetical protein
MVWVLLEQGLQETNGFISLVTEDMARGDVVTSNQVGRADGLDLPKQLYGLRELVIEDLQVGLV